MGDGEEQGIVKIADFGLARIYQAPLKPLYENGVRCFLSYLKFYFLLFVFLISLVAKEAVG